MILRFLVFSAVVWGQMEPLAERSYALMRGGSFAGPGGDRVNFVLVEPKLPGRRPAVLYQHGGGQSMSNYISEALILASCGVTSLLVDVPPFPPMVTPASMDALVQGEQLALDLLLRQTGVDPSRVAYVGHSYGAIAGSILAGREPRFSAYILSGGVPSIARHLQESNSPYWAEMKNHPGLADLAAYDASHFLPGSRAPMLIQCARFDTPDNVRGCPELHRLAGGPKTLTWYDDDHNFTSLDAMRDRVFWLTRQFGVKGASKALQRAVRPPGR